MRKSTAKYVNEPMEAQPEAYGYLTGNARAPNACIHPGWTEDRVDILKRLWVDGASCSQIAKRLGGVTRNAVIGKVNRLGLQGRGKPSPPSKPTRVVAMPRRENRTFSRIAMTPPVAPVIPNTGDAEPVRERKDEAPGPFSRPLTDLPVHACRWPLGALLDPVSLFCGEPLDPDRDPNKPPYCACHAARSVTAPKGGRPATAAELARSLRRYTAA